MAHRLLYPQEVSQYQVTTKQLQVVFLLGGQANYTGTVTTSTEISGKIKSLTTQTTPQITLVPTPCVLTTGASSAQKICQIQITIAPTVPNTTYSITPTFTDSVVIMF